MAIRKMSDLFFPEQYRLMLDNGKWYIYDTESSCPISKVDKRFAIKLINTGYVDNKHIDFLGRIVYNRSKQSVV